MATYLGVKKKRKVSDVGFDIGVSETPLRIVFGCNVHGSVFKSGNIVGEFSNESGRYFTFLCDATSQFTGIVLNVLEKYILLLLVDDELNERTLMWAFISALSFWRC